MSLKLKAVEPTLVKDISIPNGDRPIEFGLVLRRVGRKEQKQMIKHLDLFNAGEPLPDMKEASDPDFDYHEWLFKSLYIGYEGNPFATGHKKPATAAAIKAANKAFLALALEDSTYFAYCIQAVIQGMIEAGIVRVKNLSNLAETG